MQCSNKIYAGMCNCGLRTEDSHLPYTIWGLKNRHQLLDSWPQVVPAWAPLRCPGESKISMRWSWPEEPSDILTYWVFDILVLAQIKSRFLITWRTVNLGIVPSKRTHIWRYACIHMTPEYCQRLNLFALSFPAGCFPSELLCSLESDLCLPPLLPQPLH